MQSFQNICVQHDVSFQKLVAAVKHLLFWGVGKIIYPIGPTSVYILTQETPSILKRPEVIEDLVSKLPHPQSSGYKTP